MSKPNDTVVFNSSLHLSVKHWPQGKIFGVAGWLVSRLQITQTLPELSYSFNVAVKSDCTRVRRKHRPMLVEVKYLPMLIRHLHNPMMPMKNIIIRYPQQVLIVHRHFVLIQFIVHNYFLGA